MKLIKSPSRSKIIITLIVIAFIIEQHQVNCVFAALTSLTSIVQIGYSIYGILNDAHDTYNKFSTASTQDVMDQVSQISENLDRIGTRLEEKLDNTLNTLLRRLPLINKIDQDIQQLNEYITRIDRLYDEFEDYVKHPDEFDTFEVDGIIETSISRDVGDVRDVIDKMHSLIVPGRLGTLKKSLLLLLSEETQENFAELCDTGAPPQERIFELYSIIMMTEIRGYALSGFGYLQMSTRKNRSPMRSVKKLQEKFELRVRQYLKTLKTALELTSGFFRRCDPVKGYIRGETFVEFERFIQTFVAQESALRSNHKCHSACTYVDNPTYLYPGCTGFECGGSPSTCYGLLIDCQLQYRAEICEMNPSDARRYQYIIDANGSPHGNSDTSCQGTMYYPSSFKPNWHNCDLCRCTCVEDQLQSKSYHFISLRSQESDIHDNKVVTGVKFVMDNKILQIQIQQSTFDVNGTVSEDATEWKELEYITYDEQSSIANDRFIFHKEPGDETLKGNEDIGILTNTRKKFFLDVLHTPDKHVITGIKFAQLPYEENTAMPFYIMIRITEFNSTTGKLENLSASQWISYKDIANAYRQEIDNWNKKNPLERNNNMMNPEPNQEITVETSNHESDAAQTILPLIDSLPLYGMPPLPLSGIGLYHKAPSGEYGGFLTFIVEGLNRAPYIED